MFKIAPKGIRLRHLVGMGFLMGQVASIGYARLAPERFFCWAPYDERGQYEIIVRMHGTTLSADEATKRYKYPSRGWEPRSIYNVISLVRQYESTYGAAENAQVQIQYQRNGRPQQSWAWP